MKPAISLFFMALIAICAFISPCFAQNVIINLQPINPPIQIPVSGGRFYYDVTVSNTGASQQTFDAWIMVQLPNGSWYGPVLGPVNLTLPAGASITRQRTQQVPENAPAGTYVYEGRVGNFPSVIWFNSYFTVEKSNELWIARYNGTGNGYDYANAITTDSCGNVYVSGGAYYTWTYHDYTTIKYNSLGVQQWAASYSGLGYSGDYIYDIGVDPMGNVYVTGKADEGTTGHDFTTVKYNSAGVQQWIARFNAQGNSEELASALALDKYNNVYITGESDGFFGGYDYTTVKYSNAGFQEWYVHYNGAPYGSDFANDIAVDENMNVYVTGGSMNTDWNHDYVTIKYDSLGVQQWVARWDGLGQNTDEAQALALDEYGNVYITGFSKGEGIWYDYATIKYDSLGNEQWVALYNGPGNAHDQAYSIAVDQTGNVYVTGISTGAGTAYDYATIKYNPLGIQQWVARYNGPGNGDDYAYSLALDGTGNVYVTGSSVGTGTEDDYATIKYSPSGSQEWVVRYNGRTSGDDGATSLALDVRGNVFVTGSSDGLATEYDYCTIKYSGGNPSGAGPDWQPVEELVFGTQEAVTEYRLHPCYPNPFNATTDIRYELRAASFVSLRVYNSAGRLVTALVDGWREAGVHELTFEAGDLPSGVYFCRMQAGSYSAVQKLILLK